MKIIAVMNDSTGKIYAALDGFNAKFGGSGWIIADEITEVALLGEFGEVREYKIKWGNLSQFVDTRNYSFIYEEEAE